MFEDGAERAYGVKADMIYINILAQILVGILLSIKLNCAIACYKEEARDFKKLLLRPVGIIFAGLWLLLTLILIFICDIPGQYIQIADAILSLGVIAVVDVKRHIIPNIITIAFLCSQLLCQFFITAQMLDWLNAVFSIIVLVFLMLISRMTKEQLGMGDVKLIAVMNLMYGLSFTVYSMMLSMIIMLLFSLPLLVLKKINLKSSLPFAPFYAIGSCVFIVFNLI